MEVPKTVNQLGLGSKQRDYGELGLCNKISASDDSILLGRPATTQDIPPSGSRTSQNHTIHDRGQQEPKESTEISLNVSKDLSPNVIETHKPLHHQKK